jgi:hypothetical protein
MSSDAPEEVKTGAKLNVLSAASLSFFDQSLDFYPRLARTIPRLGRTMDSVAPDVILKRLNDDNVMGAWTTLRPSDPEFDKAIELAKASLEEAKAQTEYQDQKATRLLTVSTFLTALAGAFFTTFLTDYPLNTLPQQPNGDWLLLVATYSSFSLFIVFSLAGALVTFHATRTRFKYPTEATVDRQSGKTRSYLFFREMIGVTPEGWARSFVTVDNSKGKTTATLNPNLKVEYLKNYVSEAYLIAAKTADKLRFLEPAQSLLSYALRCLVVHIVLFAWVVTHLPSTKPATQPIEVRIIAVPAPGDVPLEQPPEPETDPKP